MDLQETLDWLLYAPWLPSWSAGQLDGFPTAGGEWFRMKAGGLRIVEKLKIVIKNGVFNGSLNESNGHIMSYLLVHCLPSRSTSLGEPTGSANLGGFFEFNIQLIGD